MDKTTALDRAVVYRRSPATATGGRAVGSVRRVSLGTTNVADPTDFTACKSVGVSSFTPRVSSVTINGGQVAKSLALWLVDSCVYAVGGALYTRSGNTA